MEKDKYQQYLFGVPIGIISPVSFFNGGIITMSTYSFLLDFLHNVYENEKFFIGYFIGAGLGGESVTADVLKDFGDILAQLVQFQGYGSLGLRMGDKHHVYENEKFFIGYFIGAGLGGESVTADVLKDFGDILAQLVQFQGYGSLGLRMGDKHHTLELSASIHGDAPNCSLKKLKSCESVRVLQAKIPRGIFESYVTWSADYVYRF